VTGAVVKAAGFDAGFLTLASVAAVALILFALTVPETQRLPASADDELTSSTVSAIGGRPFVAYK
jgi:hypothetical protein